MQAANRFLKELRANKVSLGAWQMFPSASTSRTIARTPGVSWVLIDQEHGNVGDSQMHECIANIAPYGVSPLVRIPDKERWMIKRALDAGAHGIMIPLLSSVVEVEEVVQQVCPFLLSWLMDSLSSRHQGKEVSAVLSLLMRSIYMISAIILIRQMTTPP
jgi:2-keto-3-deoxy-L-rhamnonate aldolase RhmA